MLKYRVRQCVQVLFYGLLGVLAIYAMYQLASILLDVLDMKHHDEWTRTWMAVLACEIVIAAWFLRRCIQMIIWNVHAIFRRLH